MRKVYESLAALALVILFGGYQALAEQIVFVSDRDGDNEIYTMDGDGTNQMNRSEDDSANDLYPHYCPDGRIVFSSDTDGDWEIYIMDNDGTDVDQLTTNSDNDGFPDCSQRGIVFLSDRDGGVEVCTMDQDGTNTDCDLQSSYGAASPSWLHSYGNEILYVVVGTNSTDIWKMDWDGTDEDDLTTTSDFDLGPNGSLNGSWVAFTRCDSSAENCEVYKMRADGTSVTQLTDEFESGESLSGGWNPATDSIAFSNDGDGDQEIYVMKADGSAKTQLTDNAYDDHSPDWR